MEKRLSIKEMREKTYLSQSKFANLLGIPVANISKWEQGVSSPPDYVLKLIQYYLEHQNLI
ncbi:MAG: helix-turn-helix domain-containing protein [Lachnospiraceae bacterium]|nr:helix-turn-helix domain-containing protein [Lachnospiraceae bacterium]